ncbi:hypothetical protein AAG906_001669 [Vitis piasezkii]
MAPSSIPELPEPREVPPAPSTSAPSSCRRHHRCPTAVPLTSSHPSLSRFEYRALLASFRLDHYSTTIMERMDHFQLRQDQQTLILREIQDTSVFCHQLHQRCLP